MRWALSPGRLYRMFYKSTQYISFTRDALRVTAFWLLIPFLFLLPSAVFANVLDFDSDAPNDSLRINNGDGDILDFGTSSFTIELWVKVSTMFENPVLYSSVYNLSDVTIGIDSANHAYFKLRYNGGPALGETITNTTVDFSDGEWHHIAAVLHSDVRQSLYVDGNEVGINVSTSGINYDLADQVNVGHVFDGQMDEFRIWSDARTLNELRLAANRELLGTEANLIVYYDFDIGVAGGSNGLITHVPDRTGNKDALLENFAKTGSSSNFVAETTKPILATEACGTAEALFPLSNPGSWSATATSSISTFVASNLIDNLVNSTWYSNASGVDPDHYITVDMGSTKSLAGLQYYFDDTNANARFSDYEVFTSTDGTNFESVDSGTLLTVLPDGESHAQFIEFASEVSARYYRLKSISSRGYVGGTELMPMICNSAGEFVPELKPGTCDYDHMSTASQDGLTSFPQYRYGRNWHLAKIPTGTADTATSSTANAVTAWQQAVVIGGAPAAWADASSFSSPAVLAAEWVGSSRDGVHGGNVDYLYRLDFGFLGDATLNSLYNQELLALQPTITLNLYSDNAIYNVLLNGNQLSPTKGSYSAAYNHDGFTAESKDLEWVIEPSYLVGGINTLIVHMRSGQTHAGFMAVIHTSGSCDTVTYDFGDAPDSYGTSAYATGAAHGISENLFLGGNVSADDDGMPGGSDSSDNGITFNTHGGGGSITAVVTGTNNTGSAAMLCGYMDGAADGSVNNSFERNILYLNQVGLGGGHESAPGNEELCVQVPGTASSNTTTIASIGGFNGADATCTTAADMTFSCDLNFNPDFSLLTTTYARFRLTSDSDFFSNASPFPTGLASDGEVEDYQVQYDPTSAVITAVRIERMSVDQFLSAHEPAEVTALLDAYGVIDEGQSDGTGLLVTEQLLERLDPDGDGSIALVRWSTLEEQGTIGFFVDRFEVGGDYWVRINNEMLPGLGDAPLGGEYQYFDSDALPGVDYHYRLIELEAWGSMREYGPYLLSY